MTAVVMIAAVAALDDSRKTFPHRQPCRFVGMSGCRRQIRRTLAVVLLTHESFAGDWVMTTRLSLGFWR
jgi:hypothetical protein